MDCISSCWRMTLGIALGSFLGLVFGFCRFYLPKKIKNNFAISFFFDAPKYPPPIAWIPFVILYFGIGNFSSIVLVAIGAFPPMFTQIFDGLQRINKNFVLLADNLEIFGWKRITGIYFPAVYSEFFTGLRIGSGMGWMSIIAADMVGGQEGLGYSIQLYRLNLDYSGMITTMIAIGAIGYFLQIAVRKFEYHSMKWLQNV